MVIPRKRFGQHFLQDLGIIHHLVEVIAPRRDDHMVEIGAGLGALTTQLLPRLNALDVIELDRDLIAPLTHACQALGSLQIYQADALHFDFRQLCPPSQRLRIVGNLPYQISTPLLFYLINYVDIIADLHFMLQKEVVDRLAASIGTKAYGRLSIMIQYHFAVESLFSVPSEAFYPAPKVTSAVVRLIPRAPTIKAENYALFSQIVHQAFNYRRKTIHNSLKGLVSTAQLQNYGIDANLRPEQIPIEDYVHMSNQLYLEQANHS